MVGNLRVRPTNASVGHPSSGLGASSRRIGDSVVTNLGSPTTSSIRTGTIKTAK